MEYFAMPTARKNNLVVQELEYELLVYDLDNNKAVCLNQSARLVFNYCDGETNVGEAIRRLETQLGGKVDEDFVLLTLDQLKSHGLLEDNSNFPAIPRLSRRSLMKSVAMLGIAMPIVSSIIAPSAVNAQSACAPAGLSCTTFGNPLMDNCCPQTSCTMVSGGTCCIILNTSLACNPNNDFCCPSTACNPQTLMCASLGV